MNPAAFKTAIEAALFAAEAPLAREALRALFDPDLGPVPSPEEVDAALHLLAEDCAGRAIELVQVASGWRYQVRQSHAQWVERLQAERPGRYSRAAMETLAIIAYRQPVTRAEIEDIRGVAVSTNIIRSLLEREWVRVVGHREVPGRPAVYATTRIFLDYFGLRSLEQLPSLAELLPPEEALLTAAGLPPIGGEFTPLEAPAGEGPEEGPELLAAPAGVVPEGRVDATAGAMDAVADACAAAAVAPVSAHMEAL